MTFLLRAVCSADVLRVLGFSEGSNERVQEDVDNAALMIEDLLQPQDETRNEHKRLQLRELAALNGTLKDEEVRLADVFELLRLVA
jgi:hypothetical protein